MTQTPPPVPPSQPIPPVQPASPPAGWPGQPVAVAYAVQTKKIIWPTVIGSISLVLVGLRLLDVLFSAIWGSRGGMRAGAELLGKLPSWYQQFTVFGTVIGPLFTVLLLIAAIQLLRRHKASGGLYIVYAWLAVVLSTLGLCASVMAFSQLQSQVDSIMLVSMAAGWLIGMAFPVFLLVWFRRDKVREQIAEWK